MRSHLPKRWPLTFSRLLKAVIPPKYLTPPLQSPTQAPSHAIARCCRGAYVRAPRGGLGCSSRQQELSAGQTGCTDSDRYQHHATCRTSSMAPWTATALKQLNPKLSLKQLASLICTYTYVRIHAPVTSTARYPPGPSECTKDKSSSKVYCKMQPSFKKHCICSVTIKERKEVPC